MKAWFSPKAGSEVAKRHSRAGLPVLIAAAMAVAVTTAQAQTSAGVTFAGGALSGDITLQLSNTPVPDVPGAYEVMGISGTFTDTSIGLTNGVIGGLVPVSGLPSVNSDGTFVPTGNYALTPFSYDNLFYPGGNSPIVCPPDPTSGGQPGYPYSGGVLDIYGVAFYVDGTTYSVDLWSNGLVPGAPGIDYEADDAMGATEIHADNDGAAVPVSLTATPEPGSLALLGTGLLGLLGMARRRLS